MSERQEGAFQRWPLSAYRPEWSPAAVPTDWGQIHVQGQGPRRVDAPMGFDVRALISQSFSLQG